MNYLKRNIGPGVKVPAGVGVITITSDDPLKTAYTVLYRECKKRGIPVTLAVTGHLSTLAPIGTVDNAAYGRLSVTIAQLTEILTKGGGCYVYHSTSHQEFEGQSEPDWFVREAISGADYREPVSEFTGETRENDIDRNNQTPGDWVADQIQTAGTFATDDTGAKYISCQGFVPPGQWYSSNESGSLNRQSPYWDLLAARWGRVVLMYGGDAFVRLPVKTLHNQRQTVHGWTIDQLKAMIDTAIVTGTILNIYSHEWLDDGETNETVGGGSAKSGNVPYTGDQTYYAVLTEFLDYIQTKVNAGTLMALGVGGAMSAEVGTPVNLLTNGSFAVADWSNSTTNPFGWGLLRASEAGSASLFWYKDPLAGDRARVAILKSSETDSLFGWYTTGSIQGDCETYLLKGYVRSWSSATGHYPVIKIYGGDSDSPVLNKAGVALYAAGNIQNHAGALTGMLSKPIYEYVFDGTNAPAAPFVAKSLGSVQSMVNEGNGLCSFTCTGHGMVEGDLVRFQGVTGFTGPYLVADGTTENKIVFSATYSAVDSSVGAYAAKMTWVPFTIPFALPKPFNRFAILLTNNGVNTTATANFADLAMYPAGAPVDALRPGVALKIERPAGAGAITPKSVAW